ncbi:radical SAM protein [Harryflintia acetispora]|uniref:radical SAM protein n=1 Tax=Harryflintia acetispora TaxID=1849041 RepID=UPI00189ACA80|nr:radical SAM protein [Harryflintia acetispora]
MKETFTCSLCPRRCGARRTAHAGEGVCREGTLPVLARAGVHEWEEPCISGTRGSGTVFFSGCALRCVFCQNHQISAGGYGAEVSVSRLREIYFELIAKGVHNINLVNPTHFAHAVIESLHEPLPVPVVYNCGGYERAETLRALAGKVQIYLPDLKYLDPALAARYSGAPDYPGVAKAAILEMVRQVGPCVFDDEDILQRGVVIRHLVLPGAVDNTLDVIDWVNETFAPGEVLFSLMSQYIPCGEAGRFPEIDRTISEEEYRRVEDYLLCCSLEDGYLQQRSAASDCYIPPFDLEGVLKNE